MLSYDQISNQIKSKSFISTQNLHTNYTYRVTELKTTTTHHTRRTGVSVYFSMVGDTIFQVGESHFPPSSTPPPPFRPQCAAGKKKFRSLLGVSRLAKTAFATFIYLSTV